MGWTNIQSKKRKNAENFFISVLLLIQMVLKLFSVMRFPNMWLEGEYKLSGLAQNFAINKNSTILIQSSWYSSNIKQKYSKDEYFHQVS